MSGRNTPSKYLYSANTVEPGIWLEHEGVPGTEFYELTLLVNIAFHCLFLHTVKYWPAQQRNRL